jgi:long-chain acyl-CoA synthetase
VLFTSQALAGRALELQRAVPSVELVVVLDGGAAVPGTVHLRELVPERVHPPHAADPKDCALLATTSGTTGRPRLVRVPYRSLAFEVAAFERAFPMGPGEVYLSILPLHHMFELTCGLLSALNAGAEVAYVRSLIPSDVIAALRARRATRMLVVPQFLDMLRKGLEATVRGQGPARERRFRTAQALAARLPALALRRALFGELHKQLGGRLRAFHCGGAPLAPDVAAFFETLGIAVHAGYGLTETGPVVTTNTERQHRPGSVGRPLPGVEIAIAPAPDGGRLGEILTRGPHVMLGYEGEERATADALDADGWFRTGDLGWIDERGFLYVCGRSKNLIVLDSGKKVQPEEVEGVLGRLEGVKDVCVLGRSPAGGAARGGEVVEAVVVPADELVAACRGDDEALRRALEVAVRGCRGQLTAYKLPARVHLLRGELPRTTTAKLRRDAVRRLVEEGSA